MGSDLHHGVHVQFGQCLYRAAERHPLSRLPAPVRPVQRRAGLHRPAGHGADELHRRRRQGDTGKRRFDVVQRRFHQGAVVGRALPQPRHSHAFALEAREDRFHVCRGAAHHLARAVVRGHAHTRSGGGRVQLLHRGRHARLGCEDRRHRPLSGQRSHQRATGRGEPQAVLKAEDPRGLGRRDLAEAVPHHHVRADPQARPQRGQRALQRVDRRLRPGRVVEIPRAAEHHLQQRRAPFLPEHRIATVQDRPGHRLAVVQVLPHPHPLAGLSRVRERHPGGRLRGRCRFAVRVRQRPQALAQVPAVPEHQTLPMAEVTPSHRRGPRHVRKQRVPAAGKEIPGALVEPSQVPPGQFLQRLGRLARERQKTRFAGRKRFRRRRRGSLRERNGDGPRGA